MLFILNVHNELTSMTTLAPALLRCAIVLLMSDGPAIDEILVEYAMQML